MGIGDVTRPVCAAAIEAMHKASMTKLLRLRSMATALSRATRFSAIR